MDLKSKLTSRKFWLSVAAFLASIGASIAGIATANADVTTVGMVCTVLSAAIYAACEAYVDGKSTPQESTVTTTTLTGKAVPTEKKEDA